MKVEARGLLVRAGPLSFYYVNPMDGSKVVISPEVKCLYPLRHFADHFTVFTIHTFLINTRYSLVESAYVS